MRCFLDEQTNAVQPDIIFISEENIRQDAIHGVPNMIIEVLSPGNSEHDLITKRMVYEKFGVQEIWIVFLETKETIGFTLEDGNYLESGRYSRKIHSFVLNNTTFEF